MILLKLLDDSSLREVAYELKGFQNGSAVDKMSTTQIPHAKFS